MSVKECLNAVVAWGRAQLLDQLRAETTQSAALVFSGHLGRMLLGLVSSAMLARGLGPEGLSIFSVVGAVMTVAATVADFGLANSAVREIASVLARAPQRARETVTAYGRLKLGGSLLTAGLVVVLSVPLAGALNLPRDSGAMLMHLVAASLVTAAAGDVTVTLMRALRRFGTMAAVQTANAALTVAVIGGLFLIGRLTVASALLAGALTAAASAALRFLLLDSDWRKAVIRRGGLDRSVSRRLLAFSQWLWVSAILSILSSQLDLLLLDRFFARRSVGHYALALNLSLKANLINQTLHAVLIPRVSALSSRSAYLAYGRRNLARSAAIGFLLLLALPLARPFILTVYGAAYEPSVTIFYLLMITVLLDLLTVPILLLAFPMDLPRVIAGSDGVRVAGLLGAGLLLIPSWGMAGAAVAKLVGKIGGAALTGAAILIHLRKADEINGPADHESVGSPDADTTPDPPPRDAT